MSDDDRTATQSRPGNEGPTPQDLMQYGEVAPPAAAGRRDLAERLLHAMITMQNDNDSKPMSEERLRHTARYETMGDVLEYLRSDPAVSPQDCGAGWQPIETAPLVPYKRFLIGRLIGARFDWVATAERRELDTVWGRWDSGKLSTTYRPTHWMEMPALVPKGAA